MPARDRTGPSGQGARTGRGMGNCQPGEPSVLTSTKHAWWNPLGWFGRVYLSGRGVRFRRGAGRGGRGRW
jgi:hypothetical protein